MFQSYVIEFVCFLRLSLFLFLCLLLIPSLTLVFEVTYILVIMVTINRHYKAVVQEMRDNDKQINKLCQLYVVGKAEKINKLVLKNIELQDLVDVLLEYRKMGQSAKGRSYD